MSFATRARSLTCGVVLVSVGALSLLLAGGAQAATCSATSTETLVSCVTSSNANTEANTITLAAGTYTPEAPLVLKNTHGLQTIEGPTSGGEALVEGSSLPSEEPELLVVASGVSAKVKNFVIAHAGKTPAPAVEDVGTLTMEAETDSGNLGPTCSCSQAGPRRSSTRRSPTARARVSSTAAWPP